MNRSLLLAFAWILPLSTSFLRGQDVPPVLAPPQPSPTPPLAQISTKPAADILSGLGGFELPQALGRTPKEKGGDPSVIKPGLFATFSHIQPGKNGAFSAGLTNEVARSGTQSLYIEVDKFSTNYDGAGIATNPIPVVPERFYKISLWGRMDSKKPFVFENRPVYLKLRVDFFAPDKETQTGDSVFLVQPIPNTPNRDAYFNDKTWTSFGTEIATPADAGFVTVSWRWETGSEPGETSGVIFFDDFAITGEMPEQSLLQSIQVDPELAPEAAAPAETASETPESTPSPEPKK